MKIKDFGFITKSSDPVELSAGNISILKEYRVNLDNMVINSDLSYHQRDLIFNESQRVTRFIRFCETWD